MFIGTRRIKSQKLSATAKRAIEDREYWLGAYLEASAELRRLRCESAEAKEAQRSARAA